MQQTGFYLGHVPLTGVTNDCPRMGSWVAKANACSRLLSGGAALTLVSNKMGKRSQLAHTNRFQSYSFDVQSVSFHLQSVSFFFPSPATLFPTSADIKLIPQQQLIATLTPPFYCTPQRFNTNRQTKTNSIFQLLLNKVFIIFLFSDHFQSVCVPPLMLVYTHSHKDSTFVQRMKQDETARQRHTSPSSRGHFTVITCALLTVGHSDQFQQPLLAFAEMC